jgi:hypothetical protein
VAVATSKSKPNFFHTLYYRRECGFIATFVLLVYQLPIFINIISTDSHRRAEPNGNLENDENFTL